MRDRTFSEAAIEQFAIEYPEAATFLAQLPEEDRETMTVAWMQANLSIMSMTPEEMQDLADAAIGIAKGMEQFANAISQLMPRLPKHSD